MVLESAEKKKLEHPGGDEVLARLGGKNAGLPFFAFVDAKGELIANSKRAPEGNNIGHPFAPEEIGWFMTMLQKAAPRMTVGDRKTIEDWLKTQKR